MASVIQLRERLLKKLKELFQLDQPDLDFGFYRIMHAKSQQVSKFIEKDLFKIVEDAFGQVDDTRTAAAKAAYEKAINTAKEFGAPDPENTHQRLSKQKLNMKLSKIRHPLKEISMSIFTVSLNDTMMPVISFPGDITPEKHQVKPPRLPFRIMVKRLSFTGPMLINTILKPQNILQPSPLTSVRQKKFVHWVKVFFNHRQMNILH